MRFTKQQVKKIKAELDRRLKTLQLMTIAELKAELKKMVPSWRVEEASSAELACIIARFYLDELIPDSWVW